MNQEKIGKFICNLRKEKGLTQNGLGEKLRVTGKAVSKWERGLGLPDISLLGDLCEILEVSVAELLNGEKDSKRQDAESVDLSTTLIGSLRFYEKKARNKYLFFSGIVIGCLLLIVTVLSTLYFVTNYNQVNVYNLYSTNSYLQAKGRMLFNPKTREIEIDDIVYADEYAGTTKEIKVRKAKVKFNIGDKTIIEHSFNTDKEVTLNELLKDVHIDSSSNIKMNDCELRIMKDDLNNMFLRIEYVDANGEEKVIENKLTARQTFANNKIFY